MEHSQRVWLASRECLPFRTPGSVPLFGTCLNVLEIAISLLNFSPCIPLGTFSILLHLLADSAKISLDSLNQAFLKRFSADRSIFDVNILQVKQSVNETVDDYVARIYTQTSDYNIPEEMLVDIAIQGLHAPLARIVMPQKSSTMEQFRELALLAQKTEKNTCLPQESITAAISGLEERIKLQYQQLPRITQTRNLLLIHSNVSFQIIGHKISEM